MSDIDHVSDVLHDLARDLQNRRDSEISMASEVAGQYITDHNDTAAYRAIDKQVAQLAKAWDRMIALLDATATKAETIESSCENFYGD